MMEAIRRFITNHRWIIPVSVFAAIYVIHFWATFGNGVLYGGPGDHIAGIIWLFDQYPQTPWWQFTPQAAYPWGDHLWSPLFATGQIGYIFYWLCARLVDDSVGGYTLFTGMGFALSFAVSYLFLYKRIFNRALLSSLFAALITFSPLILLLNGVGHTSYIFMPAYFISALWLTLRIFETGNWQFAVALGLLIGSTILFDPYFVLFIPLSVGAFAFVLLLCRYGARRKIVLNTLICAAAMCVLVGPVLLYIKHNAASIEATSSVTRTAMLHDAYSYSARLSDYILPSSENPLAPTGLRELKKDSYHGKDRTFTLFLGYLVLVALVVSTVWFARHKPGNIYDKNQRIIVRALGCVAIVAFLFSLPPTIEVLGGSIKMPSWYLVHMTSAWRVFARLYVILQPAILLIIAIWVSAWLKAVTAQPKKYKIRWGLIIAGCIFVLLVEYLPRNPFDGTQFWSFSKKLPTVYQKLADRSDLHVLAEYPLREQPYYQGSLYLAGQHIHQKATVNAYSPVSESTYERLSLTDINGAQTIPVLRFLGVDSLIVWNTQAQNWVPAKNVEIIHKSSFKSMFGQHSPTLYKISRNEPAHRYMVILRQDFRPGDDKQVYDLPTPISSGVTFDVVDLCKHASHNTACKQTSAKTVRFSTEVVNKSEDTISVEIKQADATIYTANILPGTRLTNVDLPLGSYTLHYSEHAVGKVLLKNFQAE